MTGSFENKRVACVFLLRDDGALLLQHRDDKPGLALADRWVPPGGHCEPCEALEDCARREFREETGYDCASLNLLCSFIDDKVEGQPAYPLTVFWARYDNVQPIKTQEGQAMEFVKRDCAASFDVPQYLVETWDRAIRALKQSLKNSSLSEEKR